MEEFSKGFNKETVCFGARLTFRKLGSAGRASKMEEFSKGLNKKVLLVGFQPPGEVKEIRTYSLGIQNGRV